MTGLKVWEDRSKVLVEKLKNIENSPDLQNINRQNTITSLIKNLRAFGLAHFNFFYSDFIEEKANAKLLDASNEFPKAAVLRWIVDQISYDIEIISRAWDQRRPGSIFANDLTKADILGHIALQPAKDNGYIDEATTILTYFQKSPSVRLMPYDKVALIGVPYTALTAPRDYLAIPHEVAHYVFRHGTVPNKENPKFNPSNLSISHYLKKMVNEILSKEHRYMENWVEELFCDIYGCIVAGPAIAIDFQDLQLDDPLKEFGDATIDREDPVPLLRPDAYLKALNKLNKLEWKNLAPNLLARWQPIRHDYWQNFVVNHGGKFKAGVNLDVETFLVRVFASEKANDIREDQITLNLAKPLDKIIDLIWKEIFQEMENNIVRNQFDWSGTDAEINSIENHEQLEQLYTFFSNAWNKLNTNGFVDNYNHQLIVWENWVEGRFEKGKKLKKWNRQTKTKDARKLHSFNENRDYGWYELAYADGWVTRGPEPNPVGD